MADESLGRRHDEIGIEIEAYCNVAVDDDNYAAGDDDCHSYPKTTGDYPVVVFYDENSMIALPIHVCDCQSIDHKNPNSSWNFRLVRFCKTASFERLLKICVDFVSLLCRSRRALSENLNNGDALLP